MCLGAQNDLAEVARAEREQLIGLLTRIVQPQESCRGTADTGQERLVTRPRKNSDNAARGSWQAADYPVKGPG